MGLAATFPSAAAAACGPVFARPSLADLSARIEASNAAVLDRDLPDALALAGRSDGEEEELARHLAEMAASLGARRLRDEQALLPLLRLGTPRCLGLASRRLTSDQVDIEDDILRLRQLCAGRPAALGRACARVETGLRQLIRLEAETLLAILEH